MAKKKVRQVSAPADVMSDEELVAPTARGYTMRDNSGTAKGGAYPDFVLRHDTPPIRRYRPSYTKGKMIVRIYPAISENKKYESIRRSATPGDFGNWVVSLPMAKFVGAEQSSKTFILCNPADPLSPRYDQNPYVILHSVLAAAIRKGKFPEPHWVTLVATKKGENFGKIVPFPQETVFCQGLVYLHNGKSLVPRGKLPLGANPGDPSVIIEMTEGTWNTIAKKLNAKKEAATCPETDYANYFQFGDIVHPVKGKFVTIYNPAHDECPEKFAKQKAIDDDRKSPEGFYSYFHRKFVDGGRVYTPELTSSAYLPEGLAKEKWVDFFEIFQFPVVEHQCRLIAEAYRDHEDLLRFGWERHPEFFTDEVESILGKKEVVAKGSAKGGGKKAPVKTSVAVGAAARSKGRPDDEDEFDEADEVGDDEEDFEDDDEADLDEDFEDKKGDADEEEEGDEAVEDGDSEDDGDEAVEEEEDEEEGEVGSDEDQEGDDSEDADEEFDEDEEVSKPAKSAKGVTGSAKEAARKRTKARQEQAKKTEERSGKSEKHRKGKRDGK